MIENTAVQRMLPGEAGNGNAMQARTCAVNGRTYAYASGTTVDAPACDAYELEANGWFRCGGYKCAGVGTTAQRTALATAGMTPGMTYLDTTLGYIVVFDGKATWRNPITGAAV